MKRRHIIQGSLFGLGVIAWAATGSSLKKQGEFEFDPNVLTLKGSPFGRTVAIAMRGPVDIYWNQGEAHDHEGHACSGAGCTHESHTHAKNNSQGGEKGSSADNLLNNARSMANEGVLLPPEDSLRGSILSRIDAWKAAYYTRTNPYGSSKIHRTFIMGETEKRLRLSYEMDPSNFAAYGSYFLFLSEALSTLQEEGQQEQLQARAAQAALGLSSHTIRVCLSRKDEPPALLTAAAAAHDYLQTRYSQGGEGAMAEVYQFLQVQDECLRDYRRLKERMIAEGTWERFPEMRRQEMDVQEYLLNKLYEGNIQIIHRNASSANQTPGEDLKS